MPARDVVRRQGARGISLIFVFPVAAVTHVIVLAFKESHIYRIHTVSAAHIDRPCATPCTPHTHRARQMSQINLNIRD